MPKNSTNIAKNPFIKVIEWRLAHNKDAIVFVVGDRRSGKSLASIRLAEIIEPKFDVGTFPPTKTTQNFFPVKHFIQAIQERPKDQMDGRVFTVQELGISAYRRNWMKEANKKFNMLLQAIGNRRLCLICTLPSLGLLDSHTWPMGAYILSSRGIDYNLSRSHFKVITIDHNPVKSKTYLKNFRYQTRQVVNPLMLGDLNFNYPSKPLMDAYLIADTAYKDTLPLDALREIEKTEMTEQAQYRRASKAAGILSNG